MLKKLLPYFSMLMMGAASSLGMAPANFWPFLLFGLAYLYFKLHLASSAKSAFFFAWSFGFGYFLFGLHWIGNALLVEGNAYQWAWPLAVMALPAALAIFTGLAGYLTKRFTNLDHISGLFGFAGIFALAEWLRGHLFTGFPWNLYGYAWADLLPMIQITSIGSVYTLTLLTLLWAATPVFMVVSSAAKKQKTILSFGIGLIAVLCLSFGHWRLNTNPTTYQESISLRLVQPNIAQADKWDRSKIVDHFYKLVELSKPETTDTTYVIWPETALHPWLANDKSSMLALQDALGPNALLFAGALELHEDTDKYANSLALIDNKGNTLQNYQKSHLVPFGEYIPFQDHIPLAPLSGFKGLHKGPGLQRLQTPEGLSYSPLICYEIIFPGAAIPPDQNRPDMIINVSNDAWYGDSSGPHQHFTHAIFRAVEEGVPIIRVANTGASGIVDPTGRTLIKTELFSQNATTVSLPQKLTQPPPKSTTKMLLFFLFALGFALFGLYKSVQFANYD